MFIAEGPHLYHSAGFPNNGADLCVCQGKHDQGARKRKARKCVS